MFPVEDQRSILKTKLFLPQVAFERYSVDPVRLIQVTDKSILQSVFMSQDGTSVFGGRHEIDHQLSLSSYEIRQALTARSF
jgi:hypothetical protein